MQEDRNESGKKHSGNESGKKHSGNESGKKHSGNESGKKYSGNERGKKHSGNECGKKHSGNEKCPVGLIVQSHLNSSSHVSHSRQSVKKSARNICIYFIRVVDKID